MSKIQSKWFTYAVMVYLMAALIWWTALLLKQNEEIYQANKRISAVTNLENDGKLEFDANRRMIIGEGIFFGLSLLLGLRFIYSANRKEVVAVNQQKNFMLAVTHELKTPLASVQLALHTLRNRTIKEVEKENLFRICETELNRLNAMIENVLLSSDSNSISLLDFKTFDIIQLIQECIDYYSKICNNTLRLFSHHHTNMEVKADLKLIKILMNNLLDNAVKYGGDEDIIVDVKIIDRNVEIQIKDVGIGIDDFEKENVFEPFYRIGSELQRKAKGTGLGLFISNKIVEAHKGRIEIKDNYPQGSVFIVSLPLNNDNE